MNNSADEHESVPEADVQAAKGGFSIVWLLPLVALAIGGWLVYKTFTEEGPTITISFKNAEGIEAGKTKVKYREVEVGRVREIDFSEDLSNVVMTVQMAPGTKAALTDSTRFWVVRPRIGASGVSGIGTLLSGAYIGIDPGKDGPHLKHFKGLEEVPLILSDTPGSHYQLLASELGSLAVGSPVSFRQIEVGEVVSHELLDDHTQVRITIFVHAPHDRFIYPETRFWNASGLSVNLDAQGMEVQMQSVVSLLAGGVGFETPEMKKPGAQAPENTEFTLYVSRKESREKPITLKIPYVLYFEDSVRGLTKGAPVEFRGIRIGTVTDISVREDLEKAHVYIPVTIELEPERIPGGVETDYDTDEERVRVTRHQAEKLVKRGFRARLETGNLLTGQRFVDFDFFPDAPPAEVVYAGEYPVLPTMPSQLTSIADSLTKVATGLERVPIEQIGKNLDETMAGVNRLVNKQELQTGVSKLGSIMTRMDRLTDNLNQASEQLSPLLARSAKTMDQARTTLGTLQDTVDDEGPIGSELMRTLVELGAAARSLRIMAEYLERHPEALLKGKSGR